MPYLLLSVYMVFKENSYTELFAAEKGKVHYNFDTVVAVSRNRASTSH